MVDRLRETPTAVGLCTANGGYITKHAFGVYGARPPAGGVPLRRAAGRGRRRRRPRELCESFDGPVTVESYTVMHDRDDEPEVGLVAVLLADGRRAWGSTHDKAVLRDMEVEEFVGGTAHAHRRRRGRLSDAGGPGPGLSGRGAPRCGRRT